MEGWLIRDHFLPPQAAYRDSVAMQNYTPLGLFCSLLAIFVMTVIYANSCFGLRSGVLFGLLFGLFAACIHPIANYVTMNLDKRLGMETTANCLVQWIRVGITIGLAYKPA
jgi:uncharacterized membrane protein